LNQQLVRLNDLDSDGLPEILYRTWADPGGSRTNKLIALSPGTLKKVWEIDVDDEFLNSSIVEIGDFDRDGIADLIIGSARREITVISGKTGEVITQYSLNFTPTMLVSVGDLNGDGIHEIANSYQTWIDDDVDSISVISIGPGGEPVDEVNLQILRTANGMTISLPGDTRGGTVQSSSDLVQWEDLFILSDSQPELAIPKEQINGARFFRLRYEAP
jgi:hypothetical protein